MNTLLLKVDKDNIDAEKIRTAAEVIRRGGLVAFPTETVYGLGANALDETATKGIFIAKGRPSDNPLIVHVADKESVRMLVEGMPETAEKLMDRFWPGPLTLVMKKSRIIPNIITAGLDTVAVRMPSHPIALALIKEAGLPVAAPSANTSGRPSPTTAKHVMDDLWDKVDMILDGGPATVGVESTVLDITGDVPMILRPGGITPSQIKSVLGTVLYDPALNARNAENSVPKSPGMKYRHYSPKAQMFIIDGELAGVVAKIREMTDEYGKRGLSVGILATEQTRDMYDSGEIISLGDRDKPETLASNLFTALREFDRRHVDIILAEAVKNEEIGLAVMNRMSKAAGGNIIKV